MAAIVTGLFAVAAALEVGTLIGLPVTLVADSLQRAQTTRTPEVIVAPSDKRGWKILGSQSKAAREDMPRAGYKSGETSPGILRDALRKVDED